MFQLLWRGGYWSVAYRIETYSQSTDNPTCMTLGCGGGGMDDGSEGAWRYHKPCQLVDFNPGPYWCDFVHNWSWLWNCLNYTRFHFCWFQKWIMRSTAWLFTRFCKLCWGLWPNVHRGRQSSFVNTDRMESCALDNPPCHQMGQHQICNRCV